VKLPSYPRYKPSGIEWLGDVPEHWSVKQLSKALIGIKDGTHGSFDRVPSSYPLLSAKNVTNTGLVLGDNESSVSEEDHHSIVRCGFPRKNDLLITIVGTIGRSCVFQGDSAVSFQRSVAFLRFTRLSEPKFFAYQVQSKYFQEQLQVRTKSAAQGGVYMGDLVKCPVFAPPLEDQRAIAAFLDREMGRVDQLVGKKRELIERLKEKRTALISRTVTRGLAPAAARVAGLPEKTSFKPSGLDWLGDIPKHWEIKPVKFVARIGNGSTPSRDNPNYWEDGDYPWLNSSVVNQETITAAEEFVTSLALRECHLPKIKPPAVLIGITGQGRTRGMASTLMFEATINQHVAYLKPLPSDAEVGFLRRVFDMVYSFLRSESDGGGSTKGAITCKQIARLKIPIPPLPEQASIAAYLDKETAKLDALVGKVEEAVERLQEYRTALITAAVTGKIDVRKVRR
jgi:type I restriction enzyme S subunit